jgi:hypothetical protein
MIPMPPKKMVPYRFSATSSEVGTADATSTNDARGGGRDVRAACTSLIRVTPPEVVLALVPVHAPLNGTNAGIIAA